MSWRPQVKPGPLANMLGALYTKTNLARWGNSVPIEPMDLDRDFDQIELLLAAEEWPFVRSDFEIGDAQPLASSFVSRYDGELAGFFTTHHFDSIGYLDMMILNPEFRGKGVALPLYFSTIRNMRKKGLQSMVVHTTNDSARLIKLLGFTPGQSFTLLTRPSNDGAPDSSEAPQLLSQDHLDLEDIVDLDGAVFGQRRRPWVEALYNQSASSYVGLGTQGGLSAIACMRPRRGGALCLDQISATNAESAAELVRQIDTAYSNQQVECFARTDGRLHSQLLDLGYTVPEFFVEIGPLVEWRKGDTKGVGQSPKVECLMWL